MQCQSITAEGIQCSRKTQDNNCCWQHKNCISTVDINNGTILPLIESLLSLDLKKYEIEKVLNKIKEEELKDNEKSLFPVFGEKMHKDKIWSQYITNDQTLEEQYKKIQEYNLKDVLRFVRYQNISDLILKISQNSIYIGHGLGQVVFEKEDNIIKIAYNNEGYKEQEHYISLLNNHTSLVEDIIIGKCFSNCLLMAKTNVVYVNNIRVLIQEKLNPIDTVTDDEMAKLFYPIIKCVTEKIKKYQWGRKKDGAICIYDFE